MYTPRKQNSLDFFRYIYFRSYFVQSVHLNWAKCFWKWTKQWSNITLWSACPLTFLIQTHLIFIVPFPVRETFKYNDLGVADGWTQEELNIMVDWVPRTYGFKHMDVSPYVVPHTDTDVYKLSFRLLVLTHRHSNTV